MKDVLKTLLVLAAAYGVFWSYSFIAAQKQIIAQQSEVIQKLTTQISQQCEAMGFVKSDVDNP